MNARRRFLGLNRPKSRSGAQDSRKPTHISPRTVGILAGAVAVVFLALRLVVAADGDVSRFIVAGTAVTDPGRVEPAIHVFESGGYDGQFYWRLATDPSHLDLDDHRGMRLDSPIRVARIAYPAIAWAVSLGHEPFVKWALPITNVVAFGVLAAVAARFAQHHRRSAFMGLAIASSTGLVMTLSRDLGEIVMVAALLGGTALIARHRFHWAAVCWMVACLAHEQALLIVVPYSVYRVAQLARTRTWKPTAADTPWLAAGAAFGMWQLVCRAAIGTFPMLETGDATLDVPLRGLARQGIDWIEHGFERQQLLVVPQLMLLTTLIVIAFRVSNSLEAQDRWLRWALIGATALAASLSQAIWVGPAELRQFVVLSTIAWLTIVAAHQPIPVALVVASATVWSATAALRIAAI